MEKLFFAVYSVEIEDIFHSLGEFVYRSLERIEYITFTKATKEKIAYWQEEGETIYPFRNKYHGKEV